MHLTKDVSILALMLSDVSLGNKVRWLVVIFSLPCRVILIQRDYKM